MTQDKDSGIDCSEIIKEKSKDISIKNDYESKGVGKIYYMMNFFDILKPDTRCSYNCTLSETCGGDPSTENVYWVNSKIIQSVYAKNDVLAGYGPSKLCIQCITNTYDIFEKEFEIS